MGCLLGLFVWPFRFLRWCFTNGGKGFIVLGVTAVVILVLFFVIKGAVTPDAPKVDLGVPSLHQAPYMVTTSSRYYYAKEAVKDKDTGIVTMTVYWELIGKKWEVNAGILPLDKSFGDVIIKKRR